MRLWKVSYDPRTGIATHEIGRAVGHALVSPLVGETFRILRVSATLFDGHGWWPIHAETSISRFEGEHGKDTERGPYNDRMFSRATRTRRVARGEHAGHTDFFVPVVLRDQVVALLAVGPIARARPTSTEVLERWRWITGRQGHPSDPEFAAYLSTTLSTLVLDAKKLASMEQLLSLFAKLMAGTGDADTLMTRIGELRAELEPVRMTERVWAAAREMVDERTTRAWHGVYHAFELKILGLSRVADHVLVGLTSSRDPSIDPVEEAIVREAFQRASVDLARARGNVIAGQVGDHGVVFLSAMNGAPHRKKQELRDLSERARDLARRQFGLDVYFGASVIPESASLSRSYHAALAAAESALAQGTRMAIAEEASAPPGDALRQLRQALYRSVEEDPDLLAARFDRYLEAVSVRCGYRIDAVRPHLDVGFDHLTESLLKSGALDPKSHTALFEGLDRAAANARTLSDLAAAYRRAVLDVSQAVQAPGAAHQERSLRRAVDYVHQHYTETLSVKRVARMAGFSESYFSRLFKQREHQNFAEYVCGLRVERAKQLLAGTELDMRRVAELSGFHSPQYFARVFRRAHRMTPLEFRTKSRAGVPDLPTEKYNQKARKVSARRSTRLLR
jgi:AraC-like DNA-binding protein